MNKYLSYEKSKRLAELGWKSESPLKYWCQIGYNYLEKKDSWGLQDHKIWIDETVSKHIGKEPIPSPDCHDLLMELQKRGCLNDGFAFIGKNFVVKYHDNNGRSIGFDPSPVEALGTALIKLLEKKQ